MGLGLGGLLWIILACAAAEPALSSLSAGTGNTSVQPSAAWAVVPISKAVPTATAMPAAPVVAPTEAVPEAGPSPTEAVTAPESDSTDESALITMEIVDEGSDPAPNVQQDPSPSSNGKYILVSISEQHLYAYDDGQLVYSFLASTGIGNSTRAGSFQVLDKIPNAYGANWNIWMPNWMGIYWSGSLENGIHALPILPGGGRLWAGYLGTPISYGCVVLGVDESLQLYDWADVGTTVEIRR